jgi:hypothetical protein
MKRIVEPSGIAIAILFILASSVSAAPEPPSETDLDAVARQRDGLRRIIAYVGDHREVFLTPDAALPGRDEKSQLRGLWEQYLDYSLGLASIEEKYADLQQWEGKARSGAFEIAYGAYLAQYRSALDLLGLLDASPHADTVLNESLPGMGFPERSYADFKFRFLNVAAAARFAALNVVAALGDAPEGVWAKLRPTVAEDRAAILGMGKGAGEAMTAKNAWKVIGDGAATLWLPAQTAVSKAMGRAKVARLHDSLVTPEQAAAVAGRMEPGDFMVQRREWYLSNLGLPGFWTHAALFIATPEERSSYFADEEVKAWVRENGRADGDFEGLLKARHPDAYERSLSKDEIGNPRTVVEAIEAGVVFTAMGHSAACDSLAALRPRLSKVEKAQAILRAFSYSGRPYDYNFDFLTDTALVCSELIYKVYEPSGGFRGISFPQTSLAGRVVTPPNEMVRRFAEQYGTAAQQADLVLFLDGYENAHSAAERPAEAFLASWKRPKWHIFVQGEPPESR